MKLSIVIPVFNEVLTIREILRRVLDLDVPKEVVLVDDGSTDGTRRFLDQFQHPDLKIIYHTVNQGKGAAIRTAAQHVTGDTVVIQDADLEYNPQELPNLLGFIERGEADVVYGSRFLGARRSFMFTHYIGNKVLNILTNILYNVCLTDMETCYKMMKVDFFKNLDLEANRFDIEPEMTAKIIRSGSRLIEVPITYVGRDYSEGKKIGWKDGVQAIWTLLKWRWKAYRGDEKILDHLEFAHAYNRWSASWILPFVGQRVLDVGAGVGRLAKFLTNREAVHLVDNDDRSLARLNWKFRYVDHIQAQKLDFEDPEQRQKLRDTPIDTVIMANVLQYFADDRGALAAARELLPPGGQVVVLAPAMTTLYGTLDEAASHRRRYDPDTLSRMVAESGFELVHVRLHNLIGTFGWYLNSRVLGSRLLYPGLFQFFERLMPLPRLLDFAQTLGIGQSVVVVGRKRE